MRPSEFTIINYCDRDVGGHALAVAIVNSYAFTAPVIYVEVLA